MAPTAKQSLLAVAALVSSFGSVVAQTRTDEASAATSTDPAQECAVYNVPAVAAMVPSFPTIWQIATIPAADTDARNYFNTLNSTIPKIAPKGTPDGNFSTVTPTYPASDPDCWWSFNKCTKPKTSTIPADISSCPEPMTWGLTYDDGPNCSHNAFYDYLRTQNQKATLFYIGSNVLDWPYEAQRGISDGHEIGVHTWSHRYMTALTNEQAFAELYYSRKAIKDVLGVTPLYWRPPFGDVDDRIRYIAQALGMQTVIWDNDVNDFRYAVLGKAAIDANYNQIINGAKNGTYSTHGTIVLSHELNNDTMIEAQTFLPQIAGAFKNVVPVGTCQNITNPYLEKEFTYPNFAAYSAGTRASNLPSPTISNVAISVAISTGAGASTASVTVAPSLGTNSVAGAAASSAPAGSPGSGSGSGSSGSKSGGVGSGMKIGGDAGLVKGLVAFAAVFGGMMFWL